MIDTTVVMGDEARDVLERAARVSGMPGTALLVMAMKRMMAKRGGLASAMRGVQYQERGSAWRRVHVSLEERDHEYFGSMRLVFKRSVSLLIAMAIERHLEEILQEKCADNYQFTGYILCEEIVDSSVCWKIYWNIPINPEKILL